MPGNPTNVIVILLLVFAAVAVPSIVAYLLFGLLRKEGSLPANPDDPERPIPIPRHSPRRRQHAGAAKNGFGERFTTIDQRSRFSQS